MLFSSLTFLFCFLPATVGIYYITPKKLRNIVLLLASIFFYAWGEVRYLPIIFMTIGISYAGAIFIERFKHKKIWLTLFILLDLSFLIYFKYANIVLENLNLIFHHNWSLKVVLPLGISFYTFQALSYLVDVYRGQIKAQSNFYKIALYITLFPQLIAGPIVKYHDIANQIDNRKETIDGVYYGIQRFIIGLSKKVLIANTLVALADKVFEQPVVEVGTGTAWLGAISYALQIYYDFSGYSDMAIGLGSMFGFKFLENFNYPFIAKSISEYWHRWHMSLGTFVKDYIYIPMGGSHCSRIRCYFNIFVAFTCIGIWHGASWNFVSAGIYYSFFIILDSMLNLHKKNFGLLGKMIQHIYALMAILFGLIRFRTDTIASFFAYSKNMFGIISHEYIPYGARYYLDRINIITLCIAILCSMPIFKNMLNWGDKHWILKIGIDLWLLVLLGLSCTQLAASTYNPFIYFRF